MAQITLTLELTPETAEALRLLAEALNPKPVLESDTPEIPKAEEKPEIETAPPAETIKFRKTKKKESETLEEKPEPDIPQDFNSEIATPETPNNDEIPDTPKIAISDIRALALPLSKASKQNVIINIMAKYGAKKLSDIAEEDYPNVMEDLRKANE